MSTINHFIFSLSTHWQTDVVPFMSPIWCQSVKNSLLLIYRPRKDERLSWPGWLTCSGWLTHITDYSAATGRSQNRKFTGRNISFYHATNWCRQLIIVCRILQWRHYFWHTVCLLHRNIFQNLTNKLENMPVMLVQESLSIYTLALYGIAYSFATIFKSSKCNQV